MGRALERFDAAWTKLDTRIVVALLALEILIVFLIVALKGLANQGDTRVSGMVFRAVLGAGLGTFIPRPLVCKATDATKKRIAAIGLGVGFALGLASGTSGSAFFANVRDWLAASSSFTLFGGAAGFVKGLTLWVALLGGSLAAARGKHIGVDIGVRLMPERARMPMVVTAWIASAAVCFAAAAGFIDYIITSDFHADEGVCARKLESGSMSERAGEITCIVRRDIFLLGRQASLDAIVIPHLARGEPFDKVLNEDQWNNWLRNGGWSSHYPSERVAALELHTGEPSLRKMPLVSIPGGEDPQDLLLREFRLVVPWGFAMIGLRLLLRALLAVLGLASVDPNLAHADDRGAEDHRTAEAKADADADGAAGSSS